MKTKTSMKSTNSLFRASGRRLSSMTLSGKWKFQHSLEWLLFPVYTQVFPACCITSCAELEIDGLNFGVRVGPTVEKGVGFCGPSSLSLWASSGCCVIFPSCDLSLCLIRGLTEATSQVLFCHTYSAYLLFVFVQPCHRHFHYCYNSLLSTTQQHRQPLAVGLPHFLWR